MASNEARLERVLEAIASAMTGDYDNRVPLAEVEDPLLEVEVGINYLLDDLALRQRHAVDYIQPGVALVADAAHTIHPLAGQGINLGLQDVAVLAEEVSAGLARGSSPGQLDVLRRYQRRRKGENLAMMAAMDGFKRLFEQEALPLRWLRNVGMRGVGQLKPLKQQLMRHAMGVL